MSLNKEERLAYIKAIKYYDPNEEVLRVTEDFSVFEYNELIKNNERIPVPVNDEELVRGLLVVLLVKIYRYRLDKIELESRVRLGGSRGVSQFSPQNDIIVKNCNNDDPFLFFEVKRPDIEISTDKTIKEQLINPACTITYFNLSKYLVYATILPPEDESHIPLKIISIDFDKYKHIGDTDRIFNQWVEENRAIAFTDIPINYGSPEIKNYVKGGENDLLDNLNLKDIRNKWKIIWDRIWGGTVEDNKKFGEFNKLLLAKIYDEKEKKAGETYDFQVKYTMGKIQTPKEVFFDINKLYKLAYRKYLGRNIEYKDIIGIDNKVLSEDVIFDIVRCIQEVSFTRNVFKNIDILAEFYETVLREGFKQTKGLYLTPPNIVLTLIAGLNIEEIVDKALEEGNNNEFRFRLPFIIDPSCGTGTFLIWVMKYVTDYVIKNKKRLKQLNTEAEIFINSNFSEDSPNAWARDYIYGIEQEPMLATASQINMILHGDGSTNIYNTDGVLPFNKYSERIGSIGANNLLLYPTKSRNNKTYSKELLEVFDVIISNPPFSAPLPNTRDIENSFELRGDSEIIFFERWYQLLKPKGRLGVVLPEAFFSVDDYKDARKFLFKHFNIKAIVSLPNMTFAPHTTTLTSLLFAQKKTEEEEQIYCNLWDKYEKEFNESFNKVSTLISKISKSAKKREGDNFNIHEKIEQVFQQCITLFDNKVRFPYITNDMLNDEEQWQSVRNKLKASIQDIKEWFILSKMSNEINNTFFNFEVSEVGYKSGKKGSKDRPNKLFEAYEENESGRQKILNVQKSTSKLDINFKNINTIIGYIRSNVKWEI